MLRATRYLAIPTLNRSLRVLVRTLPFRALVPLGVAIFCMFAVLGPVADLLGGGRRPIGMTVLTGLVSGVFALGYAFGSLRRNWLLFYATLAAQLLWTFGTHSRPVALPARSTVPPQLVFDGMSTMLLMIGSYTGFLWFLNVTAARYLRVRAEMDLAHEIHQVLVPGIDRLTGGFEFFGMSSASGDVGGDLVDVVAASGDEWVGYVADVSGHGVSSGVVMGMFKSALRMGLRHGERSLSSLLDDLNAVLMPLKNGAMYVTAACVRVGQSGRVDYAVAGHLPILHVTAGTVREITTPQTAIGMFEESRFDSASIECAAGDLLALVTDGLTEVFDAADRELGVDPIKAVLASSARRPLKDVAGEIVSLARRHGAQLDDQTLLLIRRL